MDEEKPTTQQLQDTLRELSAHQEQLRIQNDELTRSRRSLEGIRGWQEKVFQNIPVGLVELDHRQRVASCNSMFLQMLANNKISHIVNKPLTVAIAAKSRIDFAQLIARVLKQGNAQAEIMLNRPEQQDMICLVKGSVATNKDKPHILLAFTDISELRESEILAARMAHRNQRILDSAQDAIIGLDKAGEVIFCNLATERISGYAAENLYGRNFHELFHPAPGNETMHGFDKHYCVIKESLTQGTSLSNHETTFKHADGHEIIVSTTLSPTFENGELSGAILILRDLAGQKGMEQELQAESRRRQRLQEIIGRSPSIALIWTLENNQPVLSFVSENIAQLGFKPAKLLNNPHKAFEFIPDHEQDSFARSLQILIKGKKDTVRITHRTTTSNNITLYFETSCWALRDQDGQCTAIEAVMSDVSQTHHALEELKSSEARFRSFIEKTPVGVCITDESGIFTFVNDAYCKTYGYAERELIGQRFTIVCQDKNRAYLENLHAKFIDGTNEVRGEWDVITKDGTPKTILADAIRFTEKNGAIRKMTFVTDITDRKQAELALQRSESNYRNLIMSANDAVFVIAQKTGKITFCNPQAGRLVGVDFTALQNSSFTSLVDQPDRLQEAIDQPKIERVKDILLKHNNGTLVPIECSLQHLHMGGQPGIVAIVRDVSDEQRVRQYLASARDIAEKANRSKSEFLANMSHEIRTPLNAIIGFSEVLKMQLYGPVDNTQYLDYIHHIHSSGSHLLELINDILDLSKVEAGKLELYEEDFNLGELFEDCINVAKAYPGGNMLDIGLVDDICKITTIYGDKTRIKQIILNLLSNAVKFTSDNGKITIECTKLSKEFRITVRDSGIGMDAEDLHKIFEPFVQAENLYSRKHAGSGLGMTLTLKLVEMHQGHISIESEPEKGTAVHILLPASRTKISTE